MAVVNPAVVCLSGGMDSTSLLLHLLKQQRQVFGLSFDYGQKHRIELDRLRCNLDYLRSSGFEIQWRLVDLSDLSSLLHSSLIDTDWQVPSGHYESSNMLQTVVPNRNAIFASIAFAQALSLAQQHGFHVDLGLGVHSGDHAIYPDCRAEFYQAIFAAFQLGNWNPDSVSMYLPYLDCSKAEILEDALHSAEQLGVDFATVFRNTMTSYEPTADGRSKGTTGSDIERILAFHQLGLKDPIEYTQPWATVVQQALEIEKQFQAQRSNR